jgi:hypothetical protein
MRGNCVISVSTYFSYQGAIVQLRAAVGCKERIRVRSVTNLK